ncbi:tyrosine-type recombinase/integrase [Streptomyces sp. NPDC059970]|uniref:tyrosine-type recombinase/integrase n=1 Tax=Streptomyces sp. NPDC059970 TaxID=3347019 RepID=UPI00368FE639
MVPAADLRNDDTSSPHTASADTSHSHATRMWEGGMRELTLQKRLGHASPESTRIYTRVSDPAAVAGYNRALVRNDAPTQGAK